MLSKLITSTTDQVNSRKADNNVLLFYLVSGGSDQLRKHVRKFMFNCIHEKLLFESIETFPSKCL